MIEILFVCAMGHVSKEIKVGVTETRIGKECRVMLNEKVVGSAKHNPEFCQGLAIRVRQDMQRKGFTCNEKVHD